LYSIQLGTESKSGLSACATAILERNTRVLTTLTNSHTANGVSWSPVLNADIQHPLKIRKRQGLTIGRISHQLPSEIRHAQQPVLWGHDDKLRRQRDG
jgi:hypothetical protein